MHKTDLIWGGTANFWGGMCPPRPALGDATDYTISEMSGIRLSTVATITKEISEAIIEILWEESTTKYMPLSEDDFRQKILDMEEMWQFPCCWAAIDGCHIPLKCPPGGMESCKGYHNFKNFYFYCIDGHS